MHSLIAAALMFGASPSGLAQSVATGPLADQSAALLPASEQVAVGNQVTKLPILHSLGESFRPQTQAQVRIERRVIVRISPLRPRAGKDVLASLPKEPLPDKFKERKMGKCIPINRIGGVQVERGNSLLLFMRDRRIVRAALKKGCMARDFYSGFYLERSEDGLMCSGRDVLQSRAGTKCELGKLRKLVRDKK